jgi:hypothetical protein
MKSRLERVKWFICRLWFIHDMDEMSCRCKNCGVDMVRLVERKPTPCLEDFMHGLHYRLVGGDAFALWRVL